MAPPLPKKDLEHVLFHTRSLWEPLRGGRIFVTGSTGFFGIWLLESFAFANKNLDLGAKLVGLSRNPSAFYAKAPHLAHEGAISLHRGDIRDFAFPKGGFTHVIHAGTTSTASVPLFEMLDTIIRGTERTLDFAAVAGAKRFLFVSSGAVYGKQPPEMTHIPETYHGSPDPMDPNSAYGEGKRVGELLCTIAHHDHGLETTIARCFAFVGPHLPLDAHFAIGNFLRDALRGTSIQINGDGTPIRSYLYASDLAIWLWTILFKAPPARAYNVGSGEDLSIKQLADTIVAALDCGLTVRLAHSPDASRPILRYVPAVERSGCELGLKVSVPLLEGIRRTACWQQTV